MFPFQNKLISEHRGWYLIILWSSDTYILYQRKLVDLEIKHLGTYCSVSPTWSESCCTTINYVLKVASLSTYNVNQNEVDKNILIHWHSISWKYYISRCSAIVEVHISMYPGVSVCPCAELPLCAPHWDYTRLQRPTAMREHPLWTQRTLLSMWW